VTIKIAHISDLHFSFLTWNPLQFFSKRWIGNFNLFTTRKRAFDHRQLETLPSLFSSFDVSNVVISGDLSSTSLRREFSHASLWTQKLERGGCSVVALPGNHDHYTRSAYKKKAFYRFFPSELSPNDPLGLHFNLSTHKVSSRFLGQGWWLVALDTACATSLISAQGYFSPECEYNLQLLLEAIPSQDRVILTNHFPLFEHEASRKTLIRSQALRDLLRSFPKVKMYLHGHTHRHCVADLRESGFPIVIDSGSAAQSVRGSWNLLEIAQNTCKLRVFSWNKEGREWKENEHQTFTFENC
jgi:3',5'-cyclic AMP phosphodiesterase CpdA